MLCRAVLAIFLLPLLKEVEVEEIISEKEQIVQLKDFRDIIIVSEAEAPAVCADLSTSSLLESVVSLAQKPTSAASDITTV